MWEITGKPKLLSKLVIATTGISVTRGSQVTLKKEVMEKIGVKEGDIVTINVSGDQTIVTKKEPEAWDKDGFLPEDFDEIKEEVRSDSTDRLEDLME
ncbi:MAG: AbrB/MazE/SpoVT family DNA-binding domain-containing protein [Candidatus Nanohaloarchaea archaeon]